MSYKTQSEYLAMQADAPGLSTVEQFAGGGSLTGSKLTGFDDHHLVKRPEPVVSEEQRRLIAQGAIVPRRERIATAIFANLVREDEWPFIEAARAAVCAADCLIEQLDRK